MPKKLNIDQFVNKSNAVHNNKYDYTLYKYVNAHTKSIIICPTHGEFSQTPNSHLNGQGCPKCGMITIGNFFRNNIKTILLEFKEIHGDKYDYSQFRYENDKTKSIIICPLHGKFHQTSHDHKKGIGCPTCGLVSRSSKRKLGIDKFIEKSNKIHSNKYIYSDVNYINNSTKIKIICKDHGPFSQVPQSHLNGCGCPKCGIIKQVISSTFTTEEFITAARKIHGDRYDYSKFIYQKINVKEIIICPIHGEFLQSPANHLQGNGCRKCKYKNQSISQPKTLVKFINEAKQTHSDRYDYTKSIYINANTKIKITCPKHGEFDQTPNHHIHGDGCPVCNKTTSIREIKFLDYLNIPNTKETRQVRILKKRVDGFNPATNTVYEFLGDYWHGNPEKFNLDDYNKVCHKTYGELYNNTFNRFNKLKQLGHTIKYIWENDWQRFVSKLDEMPKILTY